MQKQHALWNFIAEALRPWPTWILYYNVGICSAKALHFVEFYVDIFSITWSIKCFKFLKIWKKIKIKTIWVLQIFFLVKRVPGLGIGPEQRESDKTVLHLLIVIIILISYITIYYYKLLNY